MLTLQHFSSPPPKYKITVCENEGQLRSHPSSEAKQKMLEWVRFVRLPSNNCKILKVFS